MPMDGSRWRIHGEVNGVPVTLSECLEFDSDLFSGAQSIEVPQVVTGAHHGDGPLFTGFSLRMDNLYGWVDLSVLDKPAPGRPLGGPITFTVTPRERDLLTVDGMTLTLDHGWQGHHGADSASVEQHKRLGLEFSQAKELSVFLRLATQLQSLVVLASQKPSPMKAVNLTVAGENGRARHRLWHRTRAHEDTTRPVRAGMFLFTYDDIGGLAGVQGWLAACDSNPLAVALLSSHLHGGVAYAENVLTNMTNAAETYHRGRFTNAIRPKAEYRQLREALVARAPEEHREWLDGVLAHANEKRLVQRLHEMCMHAGPSFRSVAPDIDAFSRTVTKLRNRLTHFDANHEVGDQNELLSVAKATHLLVVWCLLRDLGLDEAALQRVAQSAPVRLWQHHAEHRQVPV